MSRNHVGHYCTYITDIFGVFRSLREHLGMLWEVGLVPAEGFEPPTYGLQNRCTTTVLSRHFKDTATGRMRGHSTAAGSGAINRLPVALT
jgi:hypothetical protein